MPDKPNSALFMHARRHLLAQCGRSYSMMYLRGLDALGRFSVRFYKIDNFCDFVWLSGRGPTDVDVAHVRVPAR